MPILIRRFFNIKRQHTLRSVDCVLLSKGSVRRPDFPPGGGCNQNPTESMGTFLWPLRKAGRPGKTLFGLGLPQSAATTTESSPFVRLFVCFPSFLLSFYRLGWNRTCDTFTKNELKVRWNWLLRQLFHGRSTTYLQFLCSLSAFASPSSASPKARIIFEKRPMSARAKFGLQNNAAYQFPSEFSAQLFVST